jgi:hypothetical protein
MNKKIIGKTIGTILASIFLTTTGSIGAQIIEQKYSCQRRESRNNSYNNKERAV